MRLHAWSGGPGIRALSGLGQKSMTQILFDLENVLSRTCPNLTKHLRFFRAITYLAAGTQTLSAAAISEFGTSVAKLTRCKPSFFPGVAWNTT